MLSYLPEYVEDFGQGRGISYGSLYNYDVRVPLCFYGPQFAPGVFESPVQSVDVAPTLARAMGVAPPSSSDGRVLGEAFGGMTPDLGTTVCGIALRNPVLAASGTFAYGVEFEKLVDLNALGGFVVKGLSREPIEGNPPPRVYESEAGMINSIGLQNIGVRAFVQREAAGAGAPAHGGVRQRVRQPGGRLSGSGARAQRSRGAGRVRTERELPQHVARRHLLFERSRACWARWWRRRSGWPRGR